MSRPIIVMGDRTSHGGVVLTGSPFSDINGKGIARIGDQVTCPHKGHGSVTTIVTGDLTNIIDGSPVARHGDKTACGATLISGQVLVCTDDGGGARSSNAALMVASLRNDSSDHEDEVIEQYFELLDENGSPVHGYRYDLFENEKMHTKAGVLADGKTIAIEGKSDLRLVAWLARDGATRT